MKTEEFRPCSFDGCDREGVSRFQKKTDFLCMSHYGQLAAGRPLKPLRQFRKTHKDEVGKVCTKCDQYKPWTEYYESLRSVCRDCHIKNVVEAKRKRVLG